MTDSVREPGEPTLEDVQAEFPEWRAYEALGFLWARRRDDMMIKVRGEYPDDLRSEIIRKQAQLDLEAAEQSAEAARTQ
jgi:hypothetical protein